MIFTDINYAILLSLTFLGCLVARRIIARNLILLIVSYIFYGWWDWRFLSLIILSSSIDYIAALIIDGRFPWRPRWVSRKLALSISILANLGILGAFKYLNFFIDSTIIALSIFDVTIEPRFLSIILPIGISFYTFQSMSYSIDVYRGRQRAETNPINFFLFVSFFPQLVAGPIERASNLLSQINKSKRITYFNIRAGIELIAFGLFKKMVIADNLARVVEHAFNGSDTGFLTLLIGVYAFAFQIYCDFSGYTDIARGSAKLLGFDLRLNFNVPYFSANPRDFWRRWHMSLSDWIRDYVYIPLGGRTQKWGGTTINLLLTMALCGLWHGAAWNFVLWGIYHGILLVLSPNSRDPKRRRGPVQPFLITWDLKQVLGVFITFHLVCIGWFIFRVENIEHLVTLTTGIWTLSFLSGFEVSHIIMLGVLTCPLICLEVWFSLSNRRDLRGFGEITRWGIYASLIYVAIIGQPADQAPFIYFQF